MTRGYACHFDPASTNEGLGSHARGTLFPLLHICLTTGLSPILKRLPPNLARDYSNLDLASFWGIPEDVDDDCHEVEVNTWTDPVLGSACGDAILLGERIQKMLQQCNTEKPILVCLTGALRYMNPTPPVHQWLQSHARQWEKKRHGGGDSSRQVIAAHVRVPEDFVPQRFKDENHIQKLIHALDILVPSFENNPIIGIYTEETLSQEDEHLLKHVHDVMVHRGNTRTLLDDIKGMATADIFIPSSSHLSALVGYLTSGIIVLSDQSRLEYFQPHFELKCRIAKHPEQWLSTEKQQ